MKRGQISSTALVFLLTVIIVAFLSVYGYTQIVKIRDAERKTDYIVFETGLASIVETSTDYGNVVVEEFVIPAGYKELCFVDLSNVNPINIPNKIIRNSVDDGVKKNVFLIAENNFESSYVEGFQLSHPPFYSCIQPKARQVKLMLEGLGDSVVINPPANERWCQNAQDENLCDILDLLLVEGYRAKCMDQYGLCSIS